MGGTADGSPVIVGVSVESESESLEDAVRSAISNAFGAVCLEFFLFNYNVNFHSLIVLIYGTQGNFPQSGGWLCVLLVILKPWPCSSRKIGDSDWLDCSDVRV